MGDAWIGRESEKVILLVVVLLVKKMDFDGVIKRK